jgi:hypothetical protein
MSSFVIAFVPPLQPKERYAFPPSFSELNVERIQAAYSEEHRIEYIVNGEMFTYYPASILTILNDLDLELELIRSREDHLMTLSGYTVLRSEFHDEMTWIIDQVARGPDGHDKVIGDFPASELEAQFQNALSVVWGVISEL